MKLIDADKLSADMYHEAFVKDSDMQKWDSGCWIRYKMFENALKAQPAVEPEAISKWKKEFKEYVGSLDIARDDWKGIIEYIDELPSAQSERKDALKKAVAVEAICDELMSRFDVSATYGYDFAEAVMNRIEAMAKEVEGGKQE